MIVENIMIHGIVTRGAVKRIFVILTSKKHKKSPPTERRTLPPPSVFVLLIPVVENRRPQGGENFGITIFFISKKKT